MRIFRINNPMTNISINLSEFEIRCSSVPSLKTDCFEAFLILKKLKKPLPISQDFVTGISNFGYYPKEDKL